MMNMVLFASSLLLLFTGAWWWMLWKSLVLFAAIAVCQPHNSLEMSVLLAVVFWKEIRRLYRGCRWVWWRVQDRFLT